MPSRILFIVLALFLTQDLVAKHAVTPTKSISMEKISADKLFGSSKYKSVKGREIFILRQNLEGVKHRFLVQGGIHGNETLAPIFVTWLHKRYQSGRSLLNDLSQHEDVAIDFIPYANPDATYRRSRYNANGVNLNRNFSVLWGRAYEPFGQRAFSEPETASIKKLFESFSYTATADVHGYINWIVAPSAPESISLNSKIKDQQARRYPHWLASLKSALKTLVSPYTIKRPADLGHGGSFEDWAYWKQGSFAFCLELESERRFQTFPLSITAKLNQTQLLKPKLDRFYRYEKYIYQMFKESMLIKDRRTIASND